MANILKEARKIFTGGNNTGNSTSSTIYTFKTTITAVNFKTTNSVPILLIPAQGINKIIAPIIGTIFISKAAGTAYDFGAGNMMLTWGSGGSDRCAFIPSNDFNSTSLILGALNFGAEVIGGGVNQALYLKEDTSNATIGTGSVIITFNYYIINIS